MRILICLALAIALSGCGVAGCLVDKAAHTDNLDCHGLRPTS